MCSNRPVSYSFFILLLALYMMQSALPSINAYSVNGSLLIGPQHQHINGRYVKYSIDDLMNGQFEYKVSDDIDMDPCKSSMYCHEDVCRVVSEAYFLPIGISFWNIYVESVCQFILVAQTME